MTDASELSAVLTGSAARACGICGGQLRLRYEGSDDWRTNPDVFCPSNHEVGQHDDLYECAACGTIQVGELPDPALLEHLYAGSEDTLYLAEEAGRRRTAARLLDQIEETTTPGRLLDVGCGYGLLMDVARSRGWEPIGLELSTRAAEFARDRLGLDVQAQTLEEAGFEPESFDAVTMIDLIEHLRDPVAAIRQARDLLRPGGALCIVTPDPSSPTARAFGARWWGLVPAHTYLIPRRTLQELLGVHALVLAADRPYKRDFSLDYWMHGFAERGGIAERATSAAKRWLPTQKMLRASLGDERTLIAHRVETTKPAQPLVKDRGQPKKVAIVLPAYQAELTLADVANELPEEAADRALVVDDASPDTTTETALKHGFEVLVHPANRGYGGNQKSCYVRALREGADVVVMVHADNQYDPALVPDMVAPILAGEADMVIGSRLLEDRTKLGGMPRWRWIANRFLTEAENLAFRQQLSEYHTGYRAFSADLLRRVAFLRNSDQFVFDQQIFAQAVAAGARIKEIPIPTRYFHEASSVGFIPSCRYGLETLAVLARYRLYERGVGWAPLGPPSAHIEPGDVLPHGDKTSV